MKFKITIIKFKQLIFPISIVMFTLLIVIFSKQSLFAAKQGLQLWAITVVPSLFPFFVATELLTNTNIIPQLSKLLNKFMKPLFNIPGCGAFPLLMGILSGYPVGSKIVANLRETNQCSKIECERLLSFTNNSGPLFIIGAVGVGMFGDTRTGFLLFSTHLLACITVGILFRFYKKNNISTTSVVNLSNKSSPHSQTYKTATFNSLGELLSTSIKNSANSIIMIGGFIVLASVGISFLKTLNISNVLHLFNLDTAILDSIITGIIELTNGLKLISSIHIKQISTLVIIASFLLGFGGLTVALQVLSIISKTDLSIKPYFIGKILQAVFASIYTYILLTYTNFFNLDLVPTFGYSYSSHFGQYNFYSIKLHSEATQILLILTLVTISIVYIFISNKKILH